MHWWCYKQQAGTAAHVLKHHTITPYGKSSLQFQSLLSSVVEGDEWSASRPNRFTSCHPRGKPLQDPFSAAPPPNPKHFSSSLSLLYGMKNYVHDTPLRHKAKPNVRLLCLAFRKTTRRHFAAAYPDTYILSPHSFPYGAAAIKQKPPKLIMKVAKGEECTCLPITYLCCPYLLLQNGSIRWIYWKVWIKE